VVTEATYALDAAAVLGKPSPTQEYQLRTVFGKEPPEAVRKAANGWLKAMAAARRAKWLAALHRDGDAWWALLARAGDQKDDSGRWMDSVALGRLETQLRDHEAPELLLALPGLFTALHEPRLAVTFEVAADADAPPEDDEEAAGAALEAALGRVGAVRPRSAVEALRLMPTAGLAWLAFVPLGPAPPQGPPAGPALVIGRDVEALKLRNFVTPGDLFGLRLATLPLVPGTHVSREQLVRMALGKGAGPPDRGLPVEALAWLANNHVSRHRAFKYAIDVLLDSRNPKESAKRFSAWLNRVEQATLKDLEVFEHLLPQGCEEAVELMLCDGRRVVNEANQPGVEVDGVDRIERFQQFYRLFPGEKEPRRGLMPKNWGAAWDALHADRPPAGDAADADALVGLRKALKGTRLEPRPTLAGAAWAVEVGKAGAEADTYRQWLRERLAEAGVPQEVLGALLSLAPDPEPPSVPPPAVPADMVWLRGVEPERFLGLGERWPAGSAWYPWWREGLLALHGARLLKKIDLFRVGTAHRDRRLLEAAGADRPVLIMAGLEAGPLDDPPTFWDRRADALLVELFRSRGLWPLLTAKTFLPWLRWLPTHLPPKDAEVAAEIEQRLRTRQPVDWPLIDSLAPWLPRPYLLGQIVAWGMSDDDRNWRRAVAALLRPRDDERDQARLRDDERDWLRSRLLVCGKLGSIPPWSAAELKILLPLLDPVRDVIREVLCRDAPADEKEAKDEADLIQAVRAALLKKHQPAPPPASAEQLGRRAGWAEALRELPGDTWRAFLKALRAPAS
jgi:hypothetical protein